MDVLRKWQAVSHPELATCKPEDLFPADRAEIYQRFHNDLWQRFIDLHGTIRTLEMLASFPFDLIYGPHDMEFWRLVVKNFLDASCLMLHGLVNDSGPDVHSIPSFKAKIIQWNWLSQDKRDLLKQTLRERRFDERVKSIADRVQGIRDHRLAHRLLDAHDGSPKDSLRGVSLQELRQLFDAAHSMFGALSFGSAYITLAGDLIPGTVGGEPTRTCLDEVLDAVLRSSYFVNQPERRGQWWATDRQHMNAEELEIMNDLRTRVGLPEA